MKHMLNQSLETEKYYLLRTHDFEGNPNSVEQYPRVKYDGCYLVDETGEYWREWLTDNYEDIFEADDQTPFDSDRSCKNCQYNPDGNYYEFCVHCTRNPYKPIPTDNWSLKE